MGATILLCALLAPLGSSSVSRVAAEDLPTLALSSGAASPGGTATLELSITGNPGIVTLSFDLRYDSRLEIVSLDPYEPDGKTMLFGADKGMEWLTADKESDYRRNPKRVSFGADYSRENVTDEGLILRAAFRVKEGTPIGEVLSVEIDLLPKTALNAAIETVEFAARGGAVTVIPCAHEHLTREEDFPPTCELPGYTGATLCSDCGETLTPREVLPPLGHDLAPEPFLPPTSDAPGQKPHAVCSRCGKKFRDVAGGVPLDAGEEILPPTEGSIALGAPDTLARGERFALTLSCDQLPPGEYDAAIEFASRKLTLEGITSGSAGDADGDCLSSFSSRELLAQDGQMLIFLHFSLAGSASGSIAVLELRVNDDVPRGDATVRASARSSLYDESADMYAPGYVYYPLHEAARTLRLYDLHIGDVNADGAVDSVDRTLLARHLAGWSNLPSIDLFASDVDRDGKISTRDRTVLARAIAKWDVASLAPFHGGSKPMEGGGA